MWLADLGRARVRMTLARLLQALVWLLLLWAALWLAGAVYWGAAWWLVAIAWLLVFAHALVMALEFVLQAWFNRSDPAPRATARELLRAWASESIGAVVVFGWRLPFRARRFADLVGSGDGGSSDASASGRRGVILVHGFVCNRGIWNPWLRRLHGLGVPCIALDLLPIFGSIDRYAPLIEDAVRRLTQATGHAPLLVAHSMGGLALRAWLRDFDGDARMHGVVTVASPHRGTWMARFGHASNAREMRLDGPWLQALAATRAGRTLSPLHLLLQPLRQHRRALLGRHAARRRQPPPARARTCATCCSTRRCSTKCCAGLRTTRRFNRPRTRARRARPSRHRFPGRPRTSA